MLMQSKLQQENNSKFVFNSNGCEIPPLFTILGPFSQLKA